MRNRVVGETLLRKDKWGYFVIDCCELPRERYNKLCTINYIYNYILYMKLSQRQKIRMYSHHDHDIDDLDGEFWPVMGILLAIIAVWTGFIHLIDYLTIDAIPWWAEPFTITPMIFLLIMKENYDSLNPLHWWPMFWGYNAKLPEEDRITIRPLDTERIMEQHGGPINVHIIDYEHIKFRRRKDAVIFGLKYF